MILKANPHFVELVNKFDEAAYGTTISHQEIGNLIGSDYGSSDFYYTISATRKKLLAKGKALISIQGVGYRLLWPNELPDFLLREMTKSRNRYKRLVQFIGSAPTKEMSLAAKSEFAVVADRVTEAYSGVSGSLKAASVYVSTLRLTNIEKDRKE